MFSPSRFQLSLLTRSAILLQEQQKSSRAYPCVVVPRDREKLNYSFHNIKKANNQKKDDTTNSTHSNENLSEIEDERVMKLAVRVDNILTQMNQQSTNSAFDSAFNDLVNQEKTLRESEELLLQGKTQSGEVSSSKSLSPELAWAERILEESSQNSSSPHSSSSFSQKDAMLEFLKMQESLGTNNNNKNISSSSSNQDETGSLSKRGKQLLSQLRDGDAAKLSAREEDELVEYLDSLAERDFVVPKKENNKIAANAVSTEEAEEEEPQYQKQHRFFQTLLQLNSLLDSCGFDRRRDWFLACGTALGCQREGTFIAHDNDIDIGIMYGDEIHDKILKLVSKTSPIQVAVSKQQQQQHQHSDRNESNFVCFETLGQKIYFGGFQLRLMNVATGVLVDVNLYYNSKVLTRDEECEDENDSELYTLLPVDNKNDDEGYTWFSTFYEESAKRKHSMYRYKFSFPIEMEMKSFKNISDFEGNENEDTTMKFLCPSEQYLEEYFGLDWKTPKKYSYEEGVSQKHYKNIIEE